MINRYEEFLLESKIESLILESKLMMTKDLERIFKLMTPDRIRDHILYLFRSGQDLNILQNYFDKSNDKNDEVSFVPDKKASEILGKTPLKWRVRGGIKILTFKKNAEGEYINGPTFKRLGLNLDEISNEGRIPSPGTIGEIISEVPSTKDRSKIYALFKWDGDKMCAASKEHFVPSDDNLDKIYQMKRNPMKIGKVMTALLRATGVEATKVEMESFVTNFKAAWDFDKNAFSKFDIVKGSDITKWYNEDNYENGRGTLGSSCMRHSSKRNYFGIYADNDDVCSLVILYSDDGEVINGKLKGNKIKGRALLWDTNHGKLLDRIYSNNEEDVELFIRFADENDWWHKSEQDSDSDFIAERKNQRLGKTTDWTVYLRYTEFSSYPYVDTLCYINFNQGWISNKSEDSNAYMRNQFGSITHENQEEDYEDDDDFPA